MGVGMRVWFDWKWFEGIELIDGGEDTEEKRELAEEMSESERLRLRTIANCDIK